MMRRLVVAILVAAALIAASGAAAGALYHYFPQLLISYVSATRNYIRSLVRPSGRDHHRIEPGLPRR